MLKIIAIPPVNEPGGTLVHRNGSGWLHLWPGSQIALFPRHPSSRAFCWRTCRIETPGEDSGQLEYLSTMTGADMSCPWHEPNVAMIHLASGQMVLAEINGRDCSGTGGYVFVLGREIKVARIDSTSEWKEVRE